MRGEGKARELQQVGAAVWGGGPHAQWVAGLVHAGWAESVACRESGVGVFFMSWPAHACPHTLLCNVNKVRACDRGAPVPAVQALSAARDLAEQRKNELEREAQREAQLQQQLEVCARDPEVWGDRQGVLLPTR